MYGIVHIYVDSTYIYIYIYSSQEYSILVISIYNEHLIA